MFERKLAEKEIYLDVQIPEFKEYWKTPKLRELQPSVDRLTGAFGSLQPVKMGMMEA